MFIFFAAYYVLFYHGHFTGSDEVHTYETARSLLDKGSLAIPPILNSKQGTDGLYYSKYGLGHSVVVMPFYGLGKLMAEWLPPAWRELVGGVELREGLQRWGGSVEIFFAGLAAPLVTALIPMLFFRIQIQLGVSSRLAVLCSLLLGLSTYVSTLSGFLLRHAPQTVLVLLCFSDLLRWKEGGVYRRLLRATILLAVAFHFRIDSILVFPFLVLYIFMAASPGGQNEPSLPRARELILLLTVPLISVVSVTLFWTWKFGWRDPTDGLNLFEAPVYLPLYGLLLSPGVGLWVYSPVLIGLFPAWKHFFRKHSSEAVLCLGPCLCFVLFYSKLTDWHGLWSAPGPRYLYLAVPLLLVPLGSWMQVTPRRSAAWIVTIAAILGFCVQVPLMSVNFSFAYHQLGYPAYSPPYSFLFVPDHSPLISMGAYVPGRGSGGSVAMATPPGLAGY